MSGGVQGPESSPSLARATAVAVVAVIALFGGTVTAWITGTVAAGSSRPEKTIPGATSTTFLDVTTNPPITSTTSTTVATVATVVTDSTDSTAVPATSEAPATSDVPSTSEPVDTGIALPVNAELAPMFAVTRPLIGPTTDVAGALGTFAVVPDGIPSPVDSTIEEFSVHYEGREGFYEATATFTSSASPDDIVVFYQTAMTAAGFGLTTDDPQSAEHVLEFESPDSEYNGASVRVLVETDDDPVVELTIIDAVELDTLTAFGGWARGMPTVGDGTPIEADLSANSSPDFLLTVSTEYLYEGRTVDELVGEIRGALEDGSGGFHLDPSNDDGSSTITMSHTVLVAPIAAIIDDDDGAVMRLTGSLRI